MISFNAENLTKVQTICEKYDIPLKLLGTVSDKPMFKVNQDIYVSTEALYKAYQSGIKINWGEGDEDEYPFWTFVLGNFDNINWCLFNTQGF